MENTEGQNANAKGENNDKVERAVVASLSCPPGGAGTGNTTNKGKISNRKNGLPKGCPWDDHEIPMGCQWDAHAMPMTCPWAIRELLVVCP